jgi:hypothetical protein
MLGFELERDNPAAGPGAAGQLDGAVSRECADFTRVARIALASKNNSFPCWADTSIAGIPAATPASRAAVSASSSVRNTWLNNSSSAIGSGSATRQTLPHTFFGVYDPQYVGDLMAHHRFGELAERRDELRPVRRLGSAQVVGYLVQHH